MSILNKYHLMCYDQNYPLHLKPRSQNHQLLSLMSHEVFAPSNLFISIQLLEEHKLQISNTLRYLWL